MSAENKARWSSGQDASLSRWKHGFDSRTGHQKRKAHQSVCFFFFARPSGDPTHAKRKIQTLSHFRWRTYGFENSTKDDESSLAGGSTNSAAVAKRRADSRLRRREAHLWCASLFLLARRATQRTQNPKAKTCCTTFGVRMGSRNWRKTAGACSRTARQFPPAERSDADLYQDKHTPRCQMVDFI